MIARLALLVFALGMGILPIDGAAQDQPSLTIVDQRPAGEQPPWRSFTGNIGSCDFGVWQLSEAVGAGNRLDALRDDLAARLNSSVSSITISRYDVFLNRAVAQRGFASSVAAGAHGGTAITGGVQQPSCSRDRMSVGWFDPAEVTTPNSPVIIEIAASVNGQDYAVRSAYSPDVELPSQCTFICRGGGRPRLQEPAQLAAFRAAMTKAHDALASEINARASSAQ